MALFGRNTRGEDVQRGDVFRKVGTFSGDWVVERVFDYPDMPRHVRMVERTSRRAMTVALAVLFDPTLYISMGPGDGHTP